MNLTLSSNTKTILLRLIGLVAIALMAGPLLAVIINAMVFLNMIPPELVDKAYGTALVMKGIYVWLGCFLLGIISLFIKEDWRNVLYFSPLYAPSLFAILYTVMPR